MTSLIQDVRSRGRNLNLGPHDANFPGFHYVPKYTPRPGGNVVYFGVAFPQSVWRNYMRSPISSNTCQIICDGAAELMVLADRTHAKILFQIPCK